MNMTPTITPEQVKRLTVKNGSLEVTCNKYGVSDKMLRIYDGVVYASKREAEVAAQLAVQYRMGLITKIERQVPFMLRCDGGRDVCKYIADFRVTYKDGRTSVMDVKGVLTDIFRLKAKWLKLQTGIEIEIIK